MAEAADGGRDRVNRAAGAEPAALDAGAFAALVERHGRALYRVAFRLTGNDQDARDVVQEAFYRAYRRLDRFEGRADAGTWLHRIVVNCALDQLRSAGIRPDRRNVRAVDDVQEHVASAGADPERLAASAETRRLIGEAMDHLSAMERAAFTLRHFEGCAIEEIARTLGIRDNAAKQHVFRAVRKLRVALDSQRSIR